MSIAHQRIEDTSTRRAVLPRITHQELESYLGGVVVPVVADLLKETRSANAKLTGQLEHLRRRVELLDIRLRAPNVENRALKFRIFNLEKEVALLRRAAKK